MKYKICEGIILTKIKDRTFLTSRNNGDLIELNGIASDILKQIVNNIEIKEIIKNLTERYDIDRETMQQDVLEFIQKAIEMKIIQ